ncbi:MAG: cobalt ECF transporter T component CbiQ [Actinomycetota bacterium]
MGHVGRQSGSGWAGALYQPRRTALHHCPAHLKVVAAVLFILVVVSTPRQYFVAFGCYGTCVCAVLGWARLRPGWVARRAVLEVPFVVLAVVLPFIGPAPDVTVLGVHMSESGLLSGWNIVIKGTLGVLTSIVLAATTSVPDLLTGLQRLRVPDLLVQIAAFMVRYLDVVTDQARRMQVARISRGHNPRVLWHVAVFARTLGTLFIRCFERGERVHIAMLSRGYTGAFPLADVRRGTTTQWAIALAFPAFAAVVVIWAWRVL